MKKGLTGLIICIALFSAVAAWASSTKRFDPGTLQLRTFDQVSLWEGRQIFQDSCKNCHFRGNDKNAPFLHTESKSMKAWNRVFYKKYPKCAKNGEWDNLDQEQLLLLNDYLYRYAADSYDPNDAADCG
jgi:hypothetical protein